MGKSKLMKGDHPVIQVAFKMGAELQYKKSKLGAWKDRGAMKNHRPLPVNYYRIKPSESSNE